MESVKILTSVLLTVTVAALLVTEGSAAAAEGEPSGQGQGHGVTKSPIELLGLIPPKWEIKLPIKPQKKNVTKEAFPDALVQCFPTLPLCSLTSYPPAICALHCIMDGSNVTRSLIFQFHQAVRDLCQVTDNLFDNGFQTLLDDQGLSVRRLSTYLKAQGSSSHHFPILTRASPMALPMALIKYGNSPVLNLLKPTLLGIQSSFQAAHSFIPPANVNPLCSHTDLTSPTMTLAHTLSINPQFSDILIPGFFSLSTLATLKIDPLLEPISALLKTMFLLGGVECSAVYFSLTGKKVANCKEIVGPRYQRYFDPRASRTQVCTDPVNTELVDMSKLFPNIKMEDMEVKPVKPVEALARVATNAIFFDRIQDMDPKKLKEKLHKPSD